MGGTKNKKTRERRDLGALLEKLKDDPQALELVAQLIERLAKRRRKPGIRGFSRR